MAQPFYNNNYFVRPNTTGWAPSSTFYNEMGTNTAQTQGFQWVQGEAAAKAYPVAPGNKILLMDSENPVIYLKSADMNGRPLEMEIYDLVKRNPEEVKVEESQFVRAEELDEIIDRKISEAFKRNRKQYKKKEGDK